MSIKYFAMGFTTYITLAVTYGWGDPDVMIPLLMTVVGLWIAYFLYAAVMT